MAATRLTLDLTGFPMTDKQMSRFVEAFRLVLYKATVDHTKGNITIPMDGCGNIGTLKIESFHDVAGRKNGDS